MQEQEHIRLLRHAVQLAHDNRLRAAGPSAPCSRARGRSCPRASTRSCKAMTPVPMPKCRRCAPARAPRPTPAWLAAPSTPAATLPHVPGGAGDGRGRAGFFAFDNADAQPYGLSSEGAYQRLRMPLQPPPLPLRRLDTGITAAQLYGNAPGPEAMSSIAPTRTEAPAAAHAIPTALWLATVVLVTLNLRPFSRPSARWDRRSSPPPAWICPRCPG